MIQWATSHYNRFDVVRKLRKKIRPPPPEVEADAAEVHDIETVDV
jgi:hypothetical protein